MSTAMNRRDALQNFALAALAVSAGPAFMQTAASETAAGEAFTLPPLGYAYEALEPHIDTATMKVHHSAHHAAFIKNLNTAAGKVPVLTQKPVEEILADLTVIPEAERTLVRNNLGGHFNHTFYWDLMTPGGATAPAGELADAISGTFGSTDKFVEDVNAAGLKRFGSGWVWLAVGKDKKLSIFSTPNQDTPHMVDGAKPVIGIDVWEHAYYLKHMNKRGDYLKAWWNVLNWDKVAANFKKATA